jgi:hypothetical protein
MQGFVDLVASQSQVADMPAGDIHDYHHKCYHALSSYGLETRRAWSSRLRTAFHVMRARLFTSNIPTEKK